MAYNPHKDKLTERKSRADTPAFAAFRDKHVAMTDTNASASASPKANASASALQSALSKPDKKGSAEHRNINFLNRNPDGSLQIPPGYILLGPKGGPLEHIQLESREPVFNSMTAAQTVQECYEIFIDRRDYNLRLIDWVKDPNTTLNELNTFSRIRFGVQLNSKKELQDNLIAILTAQVSSYSNYISKIEAGITEAGIDEIFSGLLFHAKTSLTNKSPHKFKTTNPRNKRYQAEEYFYKILRDKLRPFVSPETTELFEYFDPNDLSFNEAKFIDKFIMQPTSRFRTTQERFLGGSGQDEPTIDKHVSTFLNLLLISRVEDTQRRMDENKYEHKALKVVWEAVARLRSTNGITISNLINPFKEIKRIMAPVQGFTNELNEFHRKINTQWRDLLQNSIATGCIAVHTSFMKKIQQKQLSLTLSLIDVSLISSLKAGETSQLILQIDSTFNIKFSHWKKTLDAFFQEGQLPDKWLDGTHFISDEDIQALMDRFQINYDLLLEAEHAMEEYVDDLCLYCQSLLTPPDTQTDATSQAATAAAAAAPDAASGKEPKKPKRSQPVMPEILNRFTPDEWRKLVEERRQSLERERLQRRREQAEAERLSALQRQEAAQKRYTLAPVDLKAREEKIRTSLKQNPTITELFTKLYSTAYDFKHSELQALIHALQTQGFKIHAPSRDSHYAIIIEGSYGSMDEEEFTEKTGAVRPHNTDRDSFSKRTIVGLQAAFTRAGFTPAVLGLNATHGSDKPSKPAAGSH